MIAARPGAGSYLRKTATTEIEQLKTWKHKINIMYIDHHGKSFLQYRLGGQYNQQKGLALIRSMNY